MKTDRQARKLIARIKGGLGNQLFSYAAARRLALVNNAELVLDDVSGFARDRQYRRQSALDNFYIPARKATPAERLEPFERYRRALMKWWSRKKPFAERRYVEQEGQGFDHRLMALAVNGTIYLDGVWSSEDYFKDVEQTIREDLRIVPPTDRLNQSIAEEICATNSVAIHVRWFDRPSEAETHNLTEDYYRRAISLIESKTTSPRYFVFSDDTNAAWTKLFLRERRANIVSNNRGDENAYADLWLMTQCRHFITANSTFSWWGAWLGSFQDKIVLSPTMDAGVHHTAAASLSANIPTNWLKL